MYETILKQKGLEYDSIILNNLGKGWDARTEGGPPLNPFTNTDQWVFRKLGFSNGSEDVDSGDNKLMQETIFKQKGLEYGSIILNNFGKGWDTRTEGGPPLNPFITHACAKRPLMVFQVGGGIWEGP